MKWFTVLLVLIMLTGAALIFDAVHSAFAQEVDAGVETAKKPGPVADEVPGEKSEMELLKDIVNAGRAKDWRQMSSLILFLVMAVLTRYRDKMSFFKGDRGGALFLLLLSVIGGIITALIAEASILSVWFVLGCVWTAVGAAGVHTLTTKILWPKDGKQYLTFLKPLFGKEKKPAQDPA